MKVWTNNNFEGFWPVGTAAVVVSKTAKEAAFELNFQLKERNLPAEVKESDMEELPMMDGQVKILCDGNY